MSWSFKTYLTFLLSIALCFAVHSAEPFGKVTHLEGEPKVIRRLKPYDVSKGDDLFLGDRVRTKVTDRLEIKTTHDDIILVAPRTSMVLKNQSKDKKKKEIFLELLGGTIRTKVQPLQKDEAFLVRTPVTVAGVRGTDFLCSSDGTTTVFEGKVAVFELTEVPTAEEQLSEETPTLETLDQNKGNEVVLNAKERVNFDQNEKQLSEPQRVSNLEVKATERVYELQSGDDQQAPGQPNQPQNGNQNQNSNDQKDEPKKDGEEKSEDKSEGATSGQQQAATGTGVTTPQTAATPEPTETTDIILEFVSPNLIKIETVVPTESVEVLDEVVEDLNDSVNEQTQEETKKIIEEVQKETETFILKFQLQHRDD